jgi:hypothetical protein
VNLEPIAFSVLITLYKITTLVVSSVPWHFNSRVSKVTSNNDLAVRVCVAAIGPRRDLKFSPERSSSSQGCSSIPAKMPVLVLTIAHRRYVVWHSACTGQRVLSNDGDTQQDPQTPSCSHYRDSFKRGVTFPTFFRTRTVRCTIAVHRVR